MAAVDAYEQMVIEDLKRDYRTDCAVTSIVRAQGAKCPDPKLSRIVQLRADREAGA